MKKNIIKTLEENFQIIYKKIKGQLAYQKKYL